MTSAQRRWIGLALGVVLVVPLLVPVALRLRVQRTANALRARIEAARERHARSGPHSRGHPSSSCEVAATLVASGAADLPRADLVTAVERALACDSSWERSGTRWSVLMDFAAPNTHLEADGDRAIEFLDLTSSRADDVASMRDEAIGLSYGGFGRPNLILGAIDSVEAFRQQMRMAAVALGADTSDPRLASVFTAEPMLVEHSSDGVSVTYTTHDTLHPVAVLTPSGETELRRLDGSLIRRIRRR